MRVPHLAIVGLLAGLTGAADATAQDPFVYRECLAQCRQFKDRACCHETCSYTACIADKTRASVGHGTAKDGVRLDQTDPGAWSAAMAACYPWITILKECSAGEATPPPGGAVETRPSPRPPAPTGRVVLRLVGAPQPTGTDANWVTVSSGTIVNKGYGYLGRYTWDEPPAELLESGQSIAMKVVAQCENGQRMATGLAISGDVEITGPTNPEPKGRVDFPANCESSPGATISAQNGGAVRIVPRKGYARGAKVRLAIGAFWGAEVVYMYEAVGP
jgi:hypothetical protein